MSHRAHFNDFDFDGVSPQIQARLAGSFIKVIAEPNRRHERFRREREYVRNSERDLLRRVRVVGSDEEH
jgi:hypothetical protein